MNTGDDGLWRPILLVTLCSLFLLPCSISGNNDTCLVRKMEAERLPDLNIARSGHAAFSVNGEVMVVGGHTTNFIPTATAEYYKDGIWHRVETAFPHDIGVSVVLSSGKVLVGGGSEKPLVIGQTFAVEEYDPSTHTFRAFSCLDTKRTLASAIEIDSGRVVVSGNWYGGDSIEVFDGDRYFNFAKEVSVGRASPYILQIAPDDVLILGNGSTRGEPLLSDIVERLNGEPFHVPLLRRWQPLFHEAPFCSDTGFIGDESTGDYSWLLPVQDWQEGDSTSWELYRQLAFLLVSDTTFTLLPTTCPVPKKGPYGEIHRKRRPVATTSVEASPAAGEKTLDSGDASSQLMSRISLLMEQEQLYLDSDLKLADLATRLGINRNAVSACINSQRGCSFSQFIINYRVEHAKALLRRQPDMKMAEAWMQSGFATESSFFRAFKAATGKTPAEWKAGND